MQRLQIPEESYFKYVKTINDTFQILRRIIEPYSYQDNAFIYDNDEASDVQGEFISFILILILIILGLSFIPRNRVFLSIGMCTSQNKQYKVDMEDTMRFIDCFGMKRKLCILFDLTLKFNTIFILTYTLSFCSTLVHSFVVCIACYSLLMLYTCIHLHKIDITL
jgi:hypothetical protein